MATYCGPAPFEAPAALAIRGKDTLGLAAWKRDMEDYLDKKRNF